MKVDLTDEQVKYLLILLEMEDKRLKSDNMGLWRDHWERTFAYLAWTGFAEGTIAALEAAEKEAVDA